MKMVVLVENSSRCRLCAEHGLSVYIEYEGKTYLLDTGATALFAENAKELGIDLSKVDTAFLSHAHYDHSGGFEEFFKENDKAAVYMQETSAENCFYRTEGKSFTGPSTCGVLSPFSGFSKFLEHHFAS